MRTITYIAVLVALTACSDRQQQHSEFGQEFASRLCPLQGTCGCDAELLIPNCEAWIEREFAATEREAIDHGLVFNPECAEQVLAEIEQLATCERPLIANTEPPCPVYTRNAGVGESCEPVASLVDMLDCRAGLLCVDGICRDPANPHILSEGESCADADIGPGYLGRCDDHLECDAGETMKCVPALFWPKADRGEACTDFRQCVDTTYCRGQVGTGPGDITEESPGVCTPPTLPGEPCTHYNECLTYCDDGTCFLREVSMCSVLGSWLTLR